MSNQKSQYVEKTLILIKPDAVKRAVIGEILQRFEKAGLKIVGIKMVHATEEHASKHYPNTEEWLSGMGNKTLEDYKQRNIDPKEKFGTDDALEIGKIIAGWNISYLSKGPVIACVLEGYHAIAAVRKLVGGTLPVNAEAGTIRGDLSSFSAALANERSTAIINLIHASGNAEEAQYEIAHWFNKNELFEYTNIHDLLNAESN